MKKNDKQSKFNILLTLVFILCIFTTLNVLVYNYYYLRKAFDNVYTADGHWFISMDIILGYFSDSIGLVLSIINLILVLSVITIYLIEELEYKKKAKRIIKQILENRNG
jgi:hypothetical protein